MVLPLDHTRCMTDVRPKDVAGKGAKKPAEPSRATKASVPKKRGARKARVDGSARATSQVAQVRLQADEVKALQEVMRQLRLSRSEALREGIRLLTREATEIVAADNIQRFYDAQPAPLPVGVTPATDEELAAADEEQW